MPNARFLCSRTRRTSRLASPVQRPGSFLGRHGPRAWPGAVGSVALLVALPFALDAQIRGSERALIRQVSDGTSVTIDYGRPHARGRAPVFGGIVGWEHVWTPGANEATTLEVSNDVRLNDVEVPAGRYSLWMVPSPTTWEVVLDPDAGRYHTQPPEPAAGQIRFDVTPEEGPHVEALTFDFPEVDPEGMDLRLRWGTAVVPFRIDVPPSRVMTLDAEVAAVYPGRYDVAMAGPPPPGMPADAEPPRMAVDITYADGRLLAELVGGPPALPSEFVLVPVADHVFNPAWMMNGQVFETEVDMYFEFLLDDGRVRGFEVRGLADRLMMEAERVP